MLLNAPAIQPHPLPQVSPLEAAAILLLLAYLFLPPIGHGIPGSSPWRRLLFLFRCLLLIPWAIAEMIGAASDALTTTPDGNRRMCIVCGEREAYDGVFCVFCD